MSAVYRAAAPRVLGARERIHRSPPPVRPVAIFFVVFGLPGVALLSGVQSAKGEVFAGDRLTNGAIGAALLGFAIYAAIATFRKATLGVAVHENGLRWIERGKRIDVFWDEITSITGAHTSRRVVGQEIARSEVHRLATSNGRMLVMSNMLADVETLAERVERALMAQLLPKHRDDLAAAKRIAFGPLAVTKDRVELGSKIVQWPTHVVVEDGTISIGEGDARIDVEWSKVPNARVLLALIS